MGADPVIKTIIMADPVPVEMKSQARHLTPHVGNVTGGKKLYNHPNTHSNSVHVHAHDKLELGVLST